MIALMTRLTKGFTDAEIRNPQTERVLLASRDQQDAAMMLNTAFEILSGLTGDCPKFRHKAEAVEWIKTFTGHVTLNRTPK